jgi:hypothetical protein
LGGVWFLSGTKQSTALCRQIADSPQIVGRSGHSDLHLFSCIPYGQTAIQVLCESVILYCGLQVLTTLPVLRLLIATGRMDLVRTLLVQKFSHVTAGLRITDAAHTFSVCTMIWQYGVSNFNNPAKLLEIVPCVLSIWKCEKDSYIELWVEHTRYRSCFIIIHRR